jgi:uncharacterized protein
MMRSLPVVRCPHCGKQHVWDSANPSRPFCCERCKLIDLGKWANEEYRVEQLPEPDYQA